MKIKYKPAPGGRIEIRFQNKEDKTLSVALIKNIKNKTNFSPDKILYLALSELNKKYDEKGNLI